MWGKGSSLQPLVDFLHSFYLFIFTLSFPPDLPSLQRSPFVLLVLLILSARPCFTWREEGDGLHEDILHFLQPQVLQCVVEAYERVQQVALETSYRGAEGERH